MPRPHRARSAIPSALALAPLLGLGAPAAAQPASDSCGSAPTIVAGPVAYTGATSGATTDGSSTCGGANDAWYRFIAPGDGILLLDTCGSAFDTVLSIHSACPGDATNQLACSDNEALFGPCAGASATTSFLCSRLSAGQEVLIRIAGNGGATGAYTLHVTFGAGRGITVITHGFQLSDSAGTAPPNWTFTLMRAIQKRVPCSLVGYYEPSVQKFLAGSFTAGGAWQPTQNPLVLDPDQETILVFDWAVESGGLFKNDYRYEGWSEAAGDALFAALVRVTGQAASLGQFAWHFIGHSRGAVVNSEAIERLGAYGVPVDQMTMLDPHDWDQSGVPYDEDWKDWMLGMPQDAGHTWPGSWGFTTWSNVAYADNFFSTESTGVVPDGRPSGSLARELNVGALTTATIDHSRVHAWYHGTADFLATSDGDGLTIQANWYPGAARTTDGWNTSRLGGAARPAPTNGLPAYAPVWDLMADGVFNGDFRYKSPFKTDPIAGWWLHGGDQANDTLRTEAGGNIYLELNAGNSIATHNLLAIPPAATHLRLRVLEDSPGAGLYPELFIAGDLFGRWPLPHPDPARGTAWTTVDYPIDPVDRGHSVLISLMLPQGAALLGIDDLRFVTLAPPCPCPGDADGTSAVTFADVTTVLASFGASYPGSTGPGDANCDGAVTFADITSVLANFGTSCQ